MILQMCIRDSLQIGPRDPEHDALIGVGVGGNARLVQLQRAAQHPVAGAHAVKQMCIRDRTFIVRLS